MYGHAWQGGDGVWTCAVCGGDGPAVIMSCDNRCRACGSCAFPAHEVKKHVCGDRSELLQKLESMGVKREALCLPDCGRGRVAWENEYCLMWADPARTVFGVKDGAALKELTESTEDPLKHKDVVFVKI